LGITDAFDRIVKQKQDSCEHFNQDRITTNEGTFCGKCGVEIKQ